MKETTPADMPPCFEKWCQRFDEAFTYKAQKRGFRHYLGGLLGESERKNLSQMAENAIGVEYHQLHHFLTEAPWSDSKVNELRLEIMNKCLGGVEFEKPPTLHEKYKIYHSFLRDPNGYLIEIQRFETGC